MTTADMHIHTVASDGLLSCADVVVAGVSAKLSALAITDHDCVYNIEEGARLCRAAGIQPIKGVEISAYDGDVKIHVLGYGFNSENEVFARFMEELRISSLERTKKIISNLEKLGIKISEEEAAGQRFSPKTPIHVMHIARAAVAKGYSSDCFAFYGKYLSPGAPAYSNICRPTPERAIEIINAAGGIASIAHPGRVALSRNDLNSLIFRLADAGLYGIEAVYPAHTVNETAYFKEIAERLGLEITGGSDCHYSGGNRRIGSPVFHPSERLRQRLGF